MNDIMNIFRFLHSWNRWLLLVIVAVALAYFAYGWLTGQKWTKQGQTLLTVFSSLVGVQWILGLILLLVQGSQTGFGFRHYWEHLLVQTIVLGVSHMHMSWRKKDFTDKARYGRGIMLIAGVLLLIIIGIISLPSGMQWRFMSL